MIRQAELRKDWPWAKHLVEAVRAKTNEEWLSEDVYVAVATGKAAMYVLDDPQGVLVCYPEKDAWSGDPMLHIWIVYCIGGMEQFIDEAMQLLNKLAGNISAKTMVMHSPRAGWQKAGWTVKEYVYEREVING